MDFSDRALPAHERIADRFRALASARPGGVIYGIEHGLNPAEVRELADWVGGLVRRWGVGDFWDDRFLPLVVVATETGYLYRGTGTDFWPLLSDKLRADVGVWERPRFTRYFQRAHELFGLRAPPDTAWNRLFGHIAWPVTNAAAPVEIHRSLTHALRQLFQDPPASFEGGALAQALRREAHGAGSARLESWLQDDQLAGALARRLLRIDDDVSLSPEVLDRIWADLTSDRVARRALSRAVSEYQVRGRSDLDATTLPRAQLILRHTSGGPRLFLQPPTLSAAVAEPARRALRGLRVRPWSWAEPVAADDLLASRPIALDLCDTPLSDATFLPDLPSGLPDATLVARLRSMAPQLGQPLIFSGPLCSTSETHHVEGDQAWVLLSRLLEADLPEGVRKVGALASAACLHVDLRSSAARLWLRGLGIPEARAPALWPVGGELQTAGLRGPVYKNEGPILLRLANEPASGAVQVRGGDADAVLTSSQPYLLVDCAAGDHRLELTDGPSRGAFAWTKDLWAELDREPVLETIVDPPAPTLEALIRGEMVIQVRGWSGVEPATLTLSVIAGDRELSRQVQHRVRAPLTITSQSAIMRALITDLQTSQVPRHGAVHLVVEAPPAAREWWLLGRDPGTVTWKRREEGWTPEAFEQPLEQVAFSAAAPLDDPVSSQTGDVVLRLAKVDGALALDCGLVTGGMRLEAPADPALPRLERGWAGTGAGRVSASVEAFLGWSAAGSGNILTDLHRRRVARRLEAATVEQFCGDAWLAAERTYQGDAAGRWMLLAQVVVQRGMAQVDDLPAEDAWRRDTVVRQIASQLRRAAPGLWSLSDVEAGRHAEALDMAINEAWEDVFHDMFMRGQGLALTECDAGNAEEDWAGAMSEARDRCELGRLRAMVLPDRRADALRDFHYEEGGLTELSRLLDKTHADLNPRNTARWLRPADIDNALTFWIAPSRAAREPDIMESLRRLAVDRQSARAIRYAAVRHIAARGGLEADDV